MSAGRIDPRFLARLGLALGLSVLGCERQASDPPPPPARHEIVPAPPGALGAHAAGREGAPSLTSLAEPPQVPEAAPEAPETVPEPTPEPESPPDAGTTAPRRPSDGVAL